MLRGLNAAAPGLGGKARFTTGTAFDTAAAHVRGRGRPVVGPRAQEQRLRRRARSNASCSTSTSAPRSDDGGTSGLTLMLFQTQGPKVMGMPTPIPARAWPQSGTTAQVRLANGRSGGRDLLRGDRARHHRPDLAERRRRGLRAHDRPAVLPRLQRGGPGAAARGCGAARRWSLAALAAPAPDATRET